MGNRLEPPFDSGQMERELHYHFDYLARCLKQPAAIQTCHTSFTPGEYRKQYQVFRVD
ncbi:hypothetical protein [Paenibacillus apiarius]|uniref:hypothetical protein n=1 Tax=Paenibacillus apiarius TaxID=46240 RepID=UPI00197DB62F|nr:hypothetical protein [Paenibacillus apiarius]MBN3527071.1 hypothetical protein [Paenibacillus apiarius]